MSVVIAIACSPVPSEDQLERGRLGPLVEGEPEAQSREISAENLLMEILLLLEAHDHDFKELAHRGYYKVLATSHELHC